MKIQVKMGQNQSFETGSPDFILFALKRKSQLIQKKGKRGLERQTLVICAIVKETLKWLIHLQHLTLKLKDIKLKGDKESLLTCSIISHESRNQTFCRKILHQVLGNRKNPGLHFLTSLLEAAHWAGETELLSPLMAQGHQLFPQAPCLESLPPSLGELSYVHGDEWEHILCQQHQGWAVLTLCK